MTTCRQSPPNSALSTPASEVQDTVAEVVAHKTPSASRVFPKNRSARSCRRKNFPLTTMGAQRHQSVQPGLHVLLRVRRGQDRRHGDGQESQVHERARRLAKAWTHAARIRRGTRWRISLSSVVRRHEFPGAQVRAEFMPREQAAAMGKDVRFQPDHERNFAAPGRPSSGLDENRVGVYDFDRRSPRRGAPRISYPASS